MASDILLGIKVDGETGILGSFVLSLECVGYSGGLVNMYLWLPGQHVRGEDKEMKCQGLRQILGSGKVPVKVDEA